MGGGMVLCGLCWAQKERLCRKIFVRKSSISCFFLLSLLHVGVPRSSLSDDTISQSARHDDFPFLGSTTAEAATAGSDSDGKGKTLPFVCAPLLFTFEPWPDLLARLPKNGKQ